MNITIKISMKNLILAIALLSSTLLGAQTTYYLDDLAGNDSNSGISPANALQSIEKISSIQLGPGDKVLFRRGGLWNGNFKPQGSGDESRKIVIGAYGLGPAPVLDARGEIAEGEKASYTIRLFNQDNIEFRDLMVKNFKPFEVPENVKYRNNIAYTNSVKMGIYVEGKDCGSLNGIAFVNLEICDINGAMQTKHNGGIFMEITRSKDPEKQLQSNFVDLLISDCWIHDVDRTGISNTSAWWNRSLNSKFGDLLSTGEKHDWYPSEGIIIRNNRFERTGANALIVRAAKAPLIEHNLFTHCSIKGSGNSNFPFNCDDALFQYNEACYTYFNTEADSWNGRRDADAGGFDSDWKCKNTVIQYNYSHHNGYGGILICLDGGSATGFNDGTIVRYNIFENNKHHIVRSSGPVSNTLVYNNLFYSGDNMDPVMLLYHKSWNGYSDSIAYQNNIFFSGGEGNSIDLGKSTRNFFESNLYNRAIIDQPEDKDAIMADPLFSNGSGIGWKSWLGFLLQEGSPAIDKGIAVEGRPAEDFRGEPITGHPEIGPLEYAEGKRINNDE
ncbi:MAG: hypothetical protein QNK35_06105 [Bacteroides sp.]|nr:hypothetical protein [Bacteroides sp.]